LIPSSRPGVSQACDGTMHRLHANYQNVDNARKASNDFISEKHRFEMNYNNAEDVVSLLSQE
jgi:hypothetical protein